MLIKIGIILLNKEVFIKDTVISIFLRFDTDSVSCLELVILVCCDIQILLSHFLMQLKIQTTIKMNLLSCFLVKLTFRLLCYEGLMNNLNCCLSNHNFQIPLYFQKEVKICNRIKIHGIYQLPVKRCSTSRQKYNLAGIILS